jgi:ribose/xylose/arabinose/galactoside ABC-type transport system permease subunit
VVDNNLTLIGFPTLAQGMVRGAIIVVAVAIDLRLRARSTK